MAGAEMARRRVRNAIILFLGSLLAFAVRASARPQRPLRQRPKVAEAIAVMHCLKARELNWLGDAVPTIMKGKKFSVGLRHDRKTYPGEDIVFLVASESPTRGDVFELTRKDHGSHRIYNLENNGSYRLGVGETRWPNEIFGGIWTHNYVEKNIRKIVRGPKSWIRVAAPVHPLPSVTCSYYGSVE